jgi:hypothetical protein
MRKTTASSIIILLGIILLVTSCSTLFGKVSPNDGTFYSFTTSGDQKDIKAKVISLINSTWPVNPFEKYPKDIIKESETEIVMNTGLKENFISTPFLTTIKFTMADNKLIIVFYNFLNPRNNKNTWNSDMQVVHRNCAEIATFFNRNISPTEKMEIRYAMVK